MSLDHSKCKFSTGIDEQLTAGQGKLSWDGFWEFPCPECEDRMNGFLATPIPPADRSTPSPPTSDQSFTK